MPTVRNAVSECTPFGFRHFNEFARHHRADLAIKHTRFDYPSQSFAASQNVAPLDSTSPQLGKAEATSF